MTPDTYLETPFERVRVLLRRDVVGAAPPSMPLLFVAKALDRWLTEPRSLRILADTAAELRPTISSFVSSDDLVGIAQLRRVILDATEIGSVLFVAEAVAVPSTIPDVIGDESGLPKGAPPPPPFEKPEPTTWFELTVVDELGKPLDDLELLVTVDGKPRKLTTSGVGSVRVDDAHSSFGSARFVSVALAREKLRQRKIPPASQPAPTGDNVRVETVQESMPSIPLEAEKPLLLVLQRQHVRVRLIGMHFETDKSFLLPSAMHGIRRVVEVYKRCPKGNLLAVGHTDTAGKDDYNLQLSLERADAVADYLTDNVHGWLQWFAASVRHEKRWGVREEQHMLAALPQGAEPFYAGPVDGDNGPMTHAAVIHFQQWSNATRGTSLDTKTGEIDEATRRELVGAYMEIDDTTLPGDVTLRRHGCGEFFLEEETADGVDDPENRRVEIFCFDGEIDPPPPGKFSKRGSTEYPRWREQMNETIDFTTDADEVFVRVLDRRLKPMKGAPFKISWPGGAASGVSDDDAVCAALMPKGVSTFTIQWGESKDPDVAFAFRREGRRVEGDSDEAIAQRLDNLGFSEPERAERVQEYQQRRGAPRTGNVADVREEVIDWHDRGHDRPVTQD